MLEISPSDKFAIIYSDFQPEKRQSAVEKIKALFPEIIFPSVDFDVKVSGELSEVFKNYLYIRLEDKKRYALILNTLRKGLSVFEFKPIGVITGKDLKKFFHSYKEESEKLFKPGDMIQVKTGEFAGAKFPVVTVEGGKVFCETQILCFKKTMSFDLSNVQRTDLTLLPPNPLVNYEELCKAAGKRSAIIVDGTFLLYRSVFRYQNLFAKNNTKFVGGAYGFYLALLKLKSLYPESEVFVVFSGDGKSRYEENPEYLANKQKFTPVFWDRLKENQQWVERLVFSLGFYQVKKENYRVEEVIGSLATHLIEEQQYRHIYIYSTDTDFHSLVSDKITHLLPKKCSSGPGEMWEVTKSFLCEKYKVNRLDKVSWVRASISEDNERILSVNTFNERKHLDQRQVHQKFITQVANACETVDNFKESLRQKAPFKEFLEEQFDRNMQELQINTEIFRGQSKGVVQSWKGQWSEKNVLALLEECSFYKEQDAFTRHGRVLKSEW